MERDTTTISLETLAVHAGDRKRKGSYVPVTTPIESAASFFYDKIETLDKVFAEEIPGHNYTRYNNPTTNALEELLASLEGGECALATASGMSSLHIALRTALTDRRKSILAGNVLYGATFQLLMNILAPEGVEVNFADPNNITEFERALEEHRPSCVIVESMTNPLVRVAPLDSVVELAHKHGALVVVDSTFATPLLVRPISLGADFVVHSLTKYLSGHGDVTAGTVITRTEFNRTMRLISRIIGPTLGPFESYLAMRGIKTFPLRMRRQCANATKVAAALSKHERISRVYHPGLPEHPDHTIVQRLFPRGLCGAIVSFEVKDAHKKEIFRILNSLKMIVPATSLGDVHSMILYPIMSSHRNLAPEQLRKMGINDNLLRLSVGIEHEDDIIQDLDGALSQ